MPKKIDRKTQCHKCWYSQAWAEEWNRKMVKIYGCRKYYVDEMRPLYLCRSCGRAFCEECCQASGGTAVCFGCSRQASVRQLTLVG